MKAIKKEIFEIKSIEGINIAGKTNKMLKHDENYKDIKAN